MLLNTISRQIDFLTSTDIQQQRCILTFIYLFSTNEGDEHCSDPVPV
jgi:hypothetical protein